MCENRHVLCGSRTENTQQITIEVYFVLKVVSLQNTITII